MLDTEQGASARPVVGERWLTTVVTGVLGY